MSKIKKILKASCFPSIVFIAFVNDKLYRLRGLLGIFATFEHIYLEKNNLIMVQLKYICDFISGEPIKIHETIKLLDTEIKRAQFAKVSLFSVTK